MCIYMYIYIYITKNYVITYLISYNIIHVSWTPPGFNATKDRKQTFKPGVEGSVAYNASEYSNWKIDSTVPTVIGLFLDPLLTYQNWYNVGEFYLGIWAIDIQKRRWIEGSLRRNDIKKVYLNTPLNDWLFKKIMNHSKFPKKK